MKYLLLTLSLTGEKVLVRADSIVFALREKSEEEGTFTRIFLDKVQLRPDDIGCIDVKEPVEEIYKRLKKGGNQND